MAELANLANLNPSHLYKVETRQSNIGLVAFLKVIFALQIPVDRILPITFNQKMKTNGERFEDITRQLDAASINFILTTVKSWTELLESQKTK